MKLSSLLDKLKLVIQTRSVQSTIKVMKQELQLKIRKKTEEIENFPLRRSIIRGVNLSITETILTTRIAWRNATRTRYRSFLLILGILFTVALETGIVVSIDTLYDDFILDHRNQNLTDITINPIYQWNDYSTLGSISSQIRSVPNVVTASPVYYLSSNQLEEQIRSNVLLYGIDPKNHPDIKNLNLTAGQKSISGTSVIISQGIADLGFSVGQLINLRDYFPFSEETIIVKIIGIMSNEPFFGNKFGFMFILCHIETLIELIPEEQHSTYLIGEIDVQVANFLEIRTTAEAIKDRIGLFYDVFVQKDISEIEATGIRAYQTAMNLLILASFVVEFLFITNVLAIAIKDRSKEIGIMRAVGTSSRQLIQTIASEILIYSFIGCTIGIFVGTGLSAVLIGVMDEYYSGLQFERFSIHFSSIFATYLSGVIVALISGLYPIFLALTMPVVQNIHAQMQVKKSSRFQNWRLIVITGILLSTTGFILQLFIGPSRFLDFEILSIHFLVVLLIFLGTVFVELGILVFLPRIGMKILFWFDSVTRTISMRNISREFQKSLFTIMTAGMALTFIIVVGLTSAAVIVGVPDYFHDQWGGIDIVCEASDIAPKPINFTSVLEGNSYIEKASFIQQQRTKLNETIKAYVFGVDPFRYSEFAEPVILRDGDHISSAFILNQTQIIIGNETYNITNCIISELLYQRMRVPLGSNISLSTIDNRTVNITIASVIKSNVFLGNGEYIYISSAKFQEFYNTSYVRYFVASTNRDVYRTQTALLQQFTDLKEVQVITYYMEAIEASLKFQTLIFQVLFVESFILAAIAQFVCILVSTLRMERDMGIIRSMGLTKRGVFGIFMSESTALGFSTLIIGIIDGLIGSILLGWYISLSIPLSINFELYFDRILIWVGISFIITIASTILPSYRSSQKNVIDTISGRPKTITPASELRTAYLRSEPIYPFWKDEQKVIFSESQASVSGFLIDKRVDSSETIKITRSPTFLGFIKTRRLTIQTVFLILMAVVTFNYIFDPLIILNGLILSDTLWRSLLTTILILTSVETYLPSPLSINPLFLMLGLASIGPISYYFVHEKAPKRIFKNTLASFGYGIVGIIVFYLFLCGLIISFIYLALLIEFLLTETPYWISFETQIILFDNTTISFE